jgi:hypothetical protein
VPTTVDECKNGGWQHYADANGTPFKNQGDCVSYVTTKGKTPTTTKAAPRLPACEAARRPASRLARHAGPHQETTQRFTGQLTAFSVDPGR